MSQTVPYVGWYMLFKRCNIKKGSVSAVVMIYFMYVYFFNIIV